MVKRALSVVGLLLLTAAWFQPEAKSKTSLEAQLIGTWRLVSATQRLSDGTVRPDPQPGPRGTGYIMYTESGRMCTVLGNPDRPKWKVQATPTDTEVRSALDGLVAYCGTFDVNESERYVTHHIEMDRVPNIVGTDRKRYITLDGNHLILRPAPPLPPGVSEWTVEFERVSK